MGIVDKWAHRSMTRDQMKIRSTAGLRQWLEEFGPGGRRSSEEHAALFLEEVKRELKKRGEL